MTIYDALKTDHRKVQVLLHKLSNATKVESRQDLIKEIRDELVPHSRAEEAVFYNVLKGIDEARELVNHSYKEHIEAESLLRGLQVTEAIALNWKSGVTKLTEALDHHIREEEGKIFPAAKKVFSAEEAEQLGKAFLELKPKMGAGLISSQIELMANLIPKKFVKDFLAHWDTAHERKAS